MPPMTARLWFAIAFIAVLWGGSFFFFRVLAGHVPPLDTVAIRVVLAAVLLIACMRMSGRPLPKMAGTWPAFIVLGALNNAFPFALVAWAEISITSGLASILNATTPIFTVLLAHVFGNERLTVPRVVGVVLGLAGVVVLVGPSTLAGFNPANAAQLAVLVASVSYAAAAIFGRRFSRAGVPPLDVAAGQFIGASLLSMPLAAGAAFLGALRHGGSSVAGDMHLSAVSVLALLGLAVLSTALPYPIFFHILAKAGATNALLVTLLMPVSAMALGAAFLGERFGWTTYLGMGIIFAALAVIDGRAIAWLARLWQTSQASEPRELA